MRKTLLLAAATTFALSIGSGLGTAWADECSGHAHDTDTAVGAVGGAAVVGLASHSIAGAVVGGVVGGLAGNAIGRANDCDHVADNRDAYEAGRADQAADQANVDADRHNQVQQQAYEAGRDDQALHDAYRRPDYHDPQYP